MIKRKTPVKRKPSPPKLADTAELCKELVSMVAFVPNQRLQDKIYKAVRQLQLLDKLAAEGGAVANLPLPLTEAGSMSKQRIVELQKSLRIAKDALERIAYGHAHNPQDMASSALDKMWRLEPKQPLQGIVGHGSKP